MATITYTVVVNNAKFLFDGTDLLTAGILTKLCFRDGDTYIFDQADSSNAGQILKFSTTADNSGASTYDTGVTIAGTAGQAGASTTIVTSGSTPDTLYYFSAGAAGYGAEFTNKGFTESSAFNLLKPQVGADNSEERWGPMWNHAIDQIDQELTAANATSVAMSIALG